MGIYGSFIRPGLAHLNHFFCSGEIVKSEIWIPWFYITGYDIVLVMDYLWFCAFGLTRLAVVDASGLPIYVYQNWYYCLFSHWYIDYRCFIHINADFDVLYRR